MKKPETSVIIPNWNGADLLKICLPSLRKQSYRDFELIIVDNGSSDDSIPVVDKLFPEARVIYLAKNVGFSPAVNLGIQQALGKFFVLINNDTRLDKNCLRFLVEAAKSRKEVGMIAAKMLNFYHPNLIDSAGDYIDAVGHAQNIGLGEKDGVKFSRPGYVFLTTGGGSLIKRELIETTGLFDDDYFAYFEDVDLSLRAQMRGFKCWFEPKARIYHIHKATSNRNKAFTEYLQFRNMTQTVVKDFPKELLLRDFNWLKIILVNLNTVRYLAGIGYLGPALRAELYILANLPKLLAKRRQIQSRRQVPVSYIIENIRPKKITFFGLIPGGV